MQTRVALTIVLGLVLAVAACEKGVIVMGRGHEDIGTPAMAETTITVSPRAATVKPRAIEASRPAVREKAEDVAGTGETPGACQNIAGSAATVRRVDDSAALYRDLTGEDAQTFLRAHVADAPPGIDEVAVYVGEDFRRNTIAVLAAGGCVLRVLLTDLKLPE